MQPIATIGLYPLKWTNTPPAHQLNYRARIWPGLIIGHYLHKYLHQIHQKIDRLKVEIVHSLVIITAVTQIDSN